AHINTRANVTSKRPVRIEPRHANVGNPSKFAVVVSEAILHPECLPAIKGLCVRIQASLQILRIDSLRPAVAEFLVNGSAGEVQPGLVEVGAEFVSPRHPDHHWSTIGHQPETRLTLAQFRFRALSLRDVPRYEK